MARVMCSRDNCPCQRYYDNENHCELIAALANIVALFASHILAFVGIYTLIDMLVKHVEYWGGYVWAPLCIMIAVGSIAAAIWCPRRAKYWNQMRWDVHQTPSSAA